MLFPLHPQVPEVHCAWGLQAGGGIAAVKDIIAIYNSHSPQTRAAETSVRVVGSFVTVSPGITKLNSVALVRKRTIPTERTPPVGEVSANFCG